MRRDIKINKFIYLFIYNNIYNIYLFIIIYICIYCICKSSDLHNVHEKEEEIKSETRISLLYVCFLIILRKMFTQMEQVMCMLTLLLGYFLDNYLRT